MDFVHLHLMASHIPVIGVLLLVPLIAFALVRRSDELGKVSLWALAFVAGAAVAVYLTGEPAEEGVESLAGISKGVIEQHEELALVATIALGVIGLLALAALFRSRKQPLSRGVVVAALFSVVGLSGLFGWTANLGGQIRHSEIGSPAVARAENGDRD